MSASASLFTDSMVSQQSNSHDILNDSQDKIEEIDDDDQVLKDSYKDFMKNYTLNWWLTQNI